MVWEKKKIMVINQMFSIEIARFISMVIYKVKDLKRLPFGLLKNFCFSHHKYNRVCGQLLQ